MSMTNKHVNMTGVKACVTIITAIINIVVVLNDFHIIKKDN